MGFLKLFQLYVYVVVVLVLFKPVESTVIIRFDRAPPARSRFSTAVFRYSIVRPDGSNPCRQNNGCSIFCELDGHTLRQCPVGSVKLKNLTVNHDHYFLLNVTTSDGKRNSSVYNWFIDTIPPTASIISKRSYTNAERTAIDITFSEPCTGQGGFKCVNTSFCDVVVNGPAHVDASTLRTIEPNIRYRLIVVFSLKSTYERVVIKMAENFCTDQAGNQFTRTNGSIVIVHFDRRPVLVDLWTSVPSYELGIKKVPRTVLATNKMEDMEIFLDFSNPVVNSTKEILSALHASAGNFIPIHGKNHGNRRFVFRLDNISRTKIVTVSFRSASILGLSGTPVSSVTPIAFLYDSTKPSVRLTTSSPRVTKESYLNVIVEFTKPVFGFQSSRIEVGGGRITRFEELSKSLYLFTVLRASQNVVSVLVPEGKANDVAGNLNLASNRLEVRQYSAPAICIALHSFVTAGLLATSLAAAVISLSSMNLGAIGALTSGTTNIVSDPSMNLLGMVGHLQVFVLSDWIAVSPPIEYSETIKGLRWLIPHEKLPWKKENMSIWANYDSMHGDHQAKMSMSLRNLSTGFYYGKRAYSSNVLNSNNFPSYLQEDFPSPTKTVSEVGGESMRNTPYGLPLDSYEYFIYFLREEPLSAFNVIRRMENYTGWQDFQMNLFWLGIGGGSLLVTHFLILLFLRWRTGTSVHVALSVPRFELFLLVLMLPCISQSSAFVIRGGTTGGIIVGALLLAIPAALILSVCMFFIIAIFMGDFVQYKEIKHTGTSEPWHTKLLIFFAARPTVGKWFYFEGLPSSFLPRFGFLFEDRKGPPVFVLVDQNDPNSIPKWIDSGQSGIGRMRAVSSDDCNSNEETKIPMSKKFLGCARSAYLILDLLRRVGLGIISGAYSSRRPSQSIVALAFTVLQLLYLFTLKPYIRRGVNVVESVSLLCEAAIFGLSIFIDRSSPFKEMRIMGFVMLAFLLITFATQLVNEWYALIRCILRISQSRNPSFKLGLKCVIKGLILPFLPRKHWSRLVPGSSQPKKGLIVPALPSPETEMERRDNGAQRIDQLSAMTATIVPILSPDSPGLTNVQATSSTIAQTSTGQRGGAKRQKGIKLESKSDMRKLRKLARASFSGSSKVEEGSSSYAPKERFGSDGASSSDS